MRCWDEDQPTLNARTTHCDPTTMPVPLQAMHPVAIYLTFAFLFLLYALLSVISSVCDVCCHQTKHCVCQEKYKNVRAAYYSAAQGDQTTWPLHHHVKDITHAHFPPPHEHTLIHTLLLFHTVRITLHRKLAREHRLLS